VFAEDARQWTERSALPGRDLEEPDEAQLVMRRASGRRGITARIARRQIESSARLGRHRWKVERSLSWLSCFRRLGVRWDRDAGRWFAFVLLACAVVCFNRL
jgi:transposase